MITNHEIQTLELSATKRDFYQLWNEVLETASKLSKRWDPTSTNESDPGIVLLKVLTAIADKLNYQIDKNTLESFLPSASQIESVKKLCELVGYDMKYYQSGKTSATIKWIGPVNSTNKTLIDTADEEVVEVSLPRFTALKNSTGDITYSTLEDCTFGYNNLENSVDCIEGQVVMCTTDNDNVVTVGNLDDNNRYYLPESQVAENGIFIYSVVNGLDAAEVWKRVPNLNTQTLGSHVYKIGYSSKFGLPYVQFPEDIGTIINDGLAIYFTRTLGINGNIAARTLTTLEPPEEWSDTETTSASLDETLFSVSNKNAATNGTNPETNTQAYNNYKKIIGTFDTLITCRDYMNKIYQLYDEVGIPVVSNVIVSDIRDDINRSVQLCSFSEYGINYTDVGLTYGDKQLSNFDLVIYPFKTVYGLDTKKEYMNSFACDFDKNNLIDLGIKQNKTISHNLINPGNDEIACIKNYLRLTAKITTTTRVNAVAQKSILEAIYKAIYAAFNARQLDFGEDIPFDSILECIQNADSRIKNVSLEEPEIVTKICQVNGTEKLIDEDSTGKSLYNKLVVRNILAGKVPLFNYDETFKPDLSEKAVSGDSLYTSVTKLTSVCNFGISDLATDGKLVDNEIIQFRAPNFRTSLTYPAYVNYYAVLKYTGTTDAIAAKFLTLKTFFAATPTMWLGADGIITKKFSSAEDLALDTAVTDSAALATERAKYGEIFIWNAGAGHWDTAADWVSGTSYYYCPLNADTFPKWYAWAKSLTYTDNESITKNYVGLCSRLNADMTRPIGYLVDSDHFKYKVLDQALSYGATASLDNYYIQDITAASTGIYGLGKDTIFGNTASGEYELGPDEYIYFNYTSSSTDATDTEATTVKNVYYGQGTRIKPNFSLRDSYTVKQNGGVYTKTIIAGTKFADAKGETNTTLALPNDSTGMFSLSASEQIEIREPIIVSFKPETDSKNIYVYWELTNNSNTFSFTDSDEGGYSYTLKEGEYFFYTDASKTDLVWYGSGTKIYSHGSLTLTKSSTSDDVSVEDILENGLDVVPWIKLTVTTDNYLTVHEYQYITLASGDILTSISLVGTDTALANKFKACVAATYTINGVDQTLPQIAVANAGWEVRSGLVFNAGPLLTQTLTKARDVITITNNGTQVPLPSSISFKTNYLCQTTAYEVDVSMDANGKALDPAFSIELFDKQDIVADFGDVKSILPINNFGTNWTKFTFLQLDNTKTKNPTINLYTKLQSTQYGLLMFYYKRADEANSAYLTLDNDTTPLVIFNNYVGEVPAEAWWTGKVVEGTPDKYLLRAGINIVKIPASHVLTIHKADTAGYDDIIIFGGLDVINAEENLGIAIEVLDYQGQAADLLTDLRAIDPGHAFYYNNVLDNTNVIDLNTAAGQTLSSPLSWYDYNNINNKFVISEIDADYMEEGIAIARTSKL